MLPDTDTVLVESIGHNGSHGHEIVGRFETAGGNIALGKGCQLAKHLSLALRDTLY